MRDLGYVDGHNLVVEGRWFVAGAAPAPEAAHRATLTIPIVMASHVDPVGSARADHVIE